MSTSTLAISAHSAGIATLFGRFEDYILNNQHNCIQNRVTLSSSAREIVMLGKDALDPIYTHLTTAETMERLGDPLYGPDMQQAWVYLLRDLAVQHEISFNPAQLGLSYTLWRDWLRSELLCVA